MSNPELQLLIADIALTHHDPDPGELPACWPTLVELGLPLIGVAEELGGSGGTLSDLVVVARALGRAAMSTPLVEASVASWVIAGSGRELDTGLGTVTIDRRGVLPWARHARRAVVVDGHAIVLADLDAPAVRVRPDLSIAGEPWDAVELGTASVAPLGPMPSPDEVRARLGLLRAAALTGAIQGTYDLTRNYVSTRHQFGKPLVRIPAVAANLARIKTALLLCEAALARAEDATLPSAAAARVLTGQAATETARVAHQLHGAIGVTAEYPLHRFTTRLWSWRDADLDQRAWSVLLGTAALLGGEAMFWEQLTA